MDIGVHLERVRKALYDGQYLATVEVEQVRKLSSGNNRAQIKAIIYFVDDSSLHFSEVVETDKCYPQVLKYEYQYIKDATRIFRYDNAPHHVNIPTFPHHKHERQGTEERILPSACPSHDKLFEEIRTFIEANHIWS